MLKIPAPVQSGGGKPNHSDRKPTVQPPETMPARPAVEPDIVAMADGVEQVTVPPSGADTEQGVDWLAWLERLVRLSQGRPEAPLL